MICSAPHCSLKQCQWYKKPKIFANVQTQSQIWKGRIELIFIYFFLQIWTTFLKQINISGIQKILNLYVLTFVEYFSWIVLILTSEDENDTTTSSDGDSYTSLCDLVTNALRSSYEQLRWETIYTILLRITTIDTRYFQE